MSKASKQSLKVLKFFANTTRGKINELKKNNPNGYFKHVPQQAEDIFHSQGYIKFEGAENTTALTRAGLDRLIMLEDHNRKEWAFWISIIAIIISSIALLKSFGVFE